MTYSNITPLWPTAITHAISKGKACPLVTAALSETLAQAATLTWYNQHDQVDLMPEDVKSRALALGRQHRITLVRQQNQAALTFAQTGYSLHLTFDSQNELHTALIKLAQESVLNRLIDIHHHELPYQRHRFYGPLKTKEFSGLLRCASKVESVSISSSGLVRNPVQQPAVEYWAERDPYSVDVEHALHQVVVQWRHKADMLLVITLPAFMSHAEIDHVVEILRHENKANRFWIAEQLEQHAKSHVANASEKSNIISMSRPKTP